MLLKKKEKKTVTFTEDAAKTKNTFYLLDGTV